MIHGFDEHCIVRMGRAEEVARAVGRSRRRCSRQQRAFLNAFLVPTTRTRSRSSDELFVPLGPPSAGCPLNLSPDCTPSSLPSSLSPNPDRFSPPLFAAIERASERHVQGSAKRLRPGLVNMRRKNCVLLRSSCFWELVVVVWLVVAAAGACRA